MRARVLMVLAAGGALLGGCHRAAAVRWDMDCDVALTRATQQTPVDVVGPRVDPRTRTGAASAAGTIPDLAAGRSAFSLATQEPERQQVNHGSLARDLARRGVGGSGTICR